MKIEQDARIVMQIAKALQGHEGPLTINLNMNASISGDEKVAGSQSLPVDDEALLSFIETFSEPRLKNFIQHIYLIAGNKFDGDKLVTAEWLGVNYRTMHRFEKARGVLPGWDGGIRREKGKQKLLMEKIE